MDQKEKGQICGGRNSLSGCSHWNPGAGTGDRFEGETSVTLGNLDVNFDTITESEETVYLVENTEQISKLGQASADQTKEKTFRLNQDLDIGITQLLQEPLQEPLTVMDM